MDLPAMQPRYPSLLASDSVLEFASVFGTIEPRVTSHGSVSRDGAAELNQEKKMPAAARDTITEDSSRDIPIVVATMPIDAQQRNLALGAVALLIVVAAIEAPFAPLQLARFDAFIPVLQTVICFVDLITAILLFAQFSIHPRPALLALASGYCASGSFAFLQTLAFPGAYAAAGLIGDGVDSPGWFFVWWHVTFPAAVLVYALTKDKGVAGSSREPRTGVAIVTTVAGVLAFIAALTWLAIAGGDYLPRLYVGGVTQQTLFANNINLFMWCWGMTVVIVIFARRRTILDLWLAVTLFAWMPNFLIAAVVTTVRFSLGWYSARIFGLIASCTVLAVLLTETTLLYGRLANAVTLLRRERANRLMSLDAATAAMAHEIRQPLTAITANAAAAMNFLKKVPLELDHARNALADIDNATRRAEKIITSIRDLFQRKEEQWQLISINDVAQEMLTLVQPDIRANGISVLTEYQDVPLVLGDVTQLRQVIFNLIKNAMEAMTATSPSSERRLRVTTMPNDTSEVLLFIEDSGPGIAPTNHDLMFEPFFTTKPAGMGLGLAISRTVIEQHGGNLRLEKTGANGTVFEIALPAARQHRG
jgi:signal transduction histidine kinase